MIPLTAFWLPILVSSVFVFIASNILWQALPFWHRSDYDQLPDDKTLIDSLVSVKSGQYLAPHGEWSKLPKEELEARMSRPMAFVLVRNPARFSFPAAIISYFIYILVVTTLIAYLASRAGRQPGALRMAATAGMLAYAFNSIADSIWYGKPWKVTAKVFIDGMIYALITGATFHWLWPH